MRKNRPQKPKIGAAAHAKLLAAAAVACSTFVSPAVQADEGPASVSPGLHRVNVGVSYGIRSVQLGHASSDRLGMAGGSVGAHADYSYRIVEGFELGAGAGYWNGPELNAFVGRLRARPYFTIGERQEVGITASAGLLLWPHAEPNATRDGTEEAYWLGPSVSIGGDYTYWISHAFGARAFVEVAYGQVDGENLNPNSTRFLAVDVGVGCRFRF